MAETDVASPPPAPVEEPVGKDASEGREGRPDRPKREYEEIPDMTVEEAHKALNALPKAEAQPDNTEHDTQVAAINEDIKKIKDQIEVLRTKIEEANEARRGQGDEMGEARNVMRALKEERDEIRAQLDAIQADSARAKAALEGHDKNRRALQSNLKYKTVGEIETAIRQMESRQQTSSMSLSDEKKLVKEIEQLKQSKKIAAKFVSQEEVVGKAKDGYGAARKTESEKYAEMKVVQEKLKAAFSVLDVMNKARDEEGGGMDALYEEKKALHEEINVKIEKIKELRNDHRARLDQWYNSRRERTKFKRALQRAEYVERQEAKNAWAKAREEEEAKQIPYESEMVLCDALVSYLETTFMKGDAPKAASAVSQPQAAASAEFGGMKMVMKKRQDEEYMGGTKKKSAKRKAGGRNAGGGKSNIIVHAIDTMESFAMLSINPPPNKAAVPDAIKALKEKKTWFSEQPRGAVTAAKTDKTKTDKAPKAKKEKAPEINNEMFPALPGMPDKPVVEEGEEDNEKADGEAEDAAGDESTAAAVVEDEEVEEGGKDEDDSTPAESVVANGGNGVASADAPEAEVEAEVAVEGDAETPASASDDEPTVESKEDGEAAAPAEDAAEAEQEVVETAEATIEETVAETEDEPVVEEKDGGKEE